MTYFKLFLIFHLILVPILLSSQQPNSIEIFENYKVWSKGKLFAFDKNSLHGPLSQLKKTNAYQLVQSRKQAHFSTTKKNKATTKFIDPVKLKNGLDDPGFYAIIAYLDHNPFYPNLLSDYHCGNITYDSENGYNHSGTDYFPWPFPWRKMYKDEMEIVAAAKGILIYKQDGYDDQHCSLTGEPWNGLTVLHEDGSTSWYIHMKKGSLTVKEINEEVEAGEYLGIIGSSGNTYAPHLHFEVYNDQGQLIDPFEGPCNSITGESWWIDQKQYKESAINKIATNKKLPVLYECPEEEIVNESNMFYPGDTIWLMSYIVNIFTNDSIEITIRKPNNSISSNWVWTSPWEFLPVSWLYFYIILDDEVKGTWTYEVKYKDVTYSHLFQFLESQSTPEINIGDAISLHPNPVSNRLNVILEDKNIESCKMELWNVNGLLINKQDVDFYESNELDINFIDYPPGIYLLRLFLGNDVASYKIIKK